MRNSGIYIIRNIINGKIYVGSSVNLTKRKNAHFRHLFKTRHHCIPLQNAYNKYGEKNLVFEVIFNCDPDFCLEFENYFLRLFKPDYNISKDAFSPMKGRRHKQETKEKFKNRNYYKGKDHYLFGKNMNAEHRRKLGESRAGKEHSIDTKRKMSETAKRINAISRIDRTKQYKKIIDNDGIMYDSMTDAAKQNGISAQTVCDILKGRHYKTRKGKSFKYVA